jgi:hypothetical protein
MWDIGDVKSDEVTDIEGDSELELTTGINICASVNTTWLTEYICICWLCDEECDDDNEEDEDNLHPSLNVLIFKF